MNNKKTIIFIGNSGCGKGTQADLIEEGFKKSGEKVTHIELGSEFRDFLSMSTHTAKHAHKISQEGKLQPEFLAIHLWAKILNLYYNDNKHLILDGTPRTLREAHVLDGALKFYNIEKPIVMYIKTSDETARSRMLLRKRKDDTEEKIQNRLKWFNLEVKKAVEFFQDSDYYDFIEIDGEKGIDKVHEEISEKIFG